MSDLSYLNIKIFPSELTFDQPPCTLTHTATVLRRNPRVQLVIFKHRDPKPEDKKNYNSEQERINDSI